MPLPSGPRVAVVIPCYDDGSVLVEAVDSLDGAAVELVIVDDASTDPQTLSLLEGLEAAGVAVARHEENKGLSEARNTGVDATSAPYVFPLDADDLAIPSALDALADRLDADANAVAAYGDYLEFGDHELLRRVPASFDPYRVTYRNEYPVSSLFRRSALEAVGGWRDPVPRAGYEDWSLWMAFAERNAVVLYAGLGLVTYKRRIHGTSMLTGSRTRNRELYRALRAAHPTLFENARSNRGRSTLGRGARLLYPLLYGGRPRLRVERWVKGAIYRLRSRSPARS